MKCENFSFSCKKVGKKFVRFRILLYLCIRFRAKNSDKKREHLCVFLGIKVKPSSFNKYYRIESF